MTFNELKDLISMGLVFLFLLSVILWSFWGEVLFGLLYIGTITIIGLILLGILEGISWLIAVGITRYNDSKSKKAFNKRLKAVDDGEV